MKDKIGRIAALCYQISEETKIDVFFDYSPHVCSISIRVYKSGWIEDTIPVWLKCDRSDSGIYMSGQLYKKGSENDIISELEAMLEDSKNE